MAFTYFVRTSSLTPALVPTLISSDWTPTLHYYGRVTLSEFLDREEADRMGLVLADEWSEEEEAERSGLYRAEMRHCL